MSTDVSPRDLVKDPTILLRKKGDSSTPLKSFEGRAGAVIQDGRFFVTSPNMTRMYSLPANTAMGLHSNLRLGDDDPLQWPQPYISSLVHYAAIPLPPPDLNLCNYPYILHCTLSNDDFVPFNDGPVTGLGHISYLNLKLLKEAAAILREKLAEYQKKLPAVETGPIFSTLLVVIDRSIRCLDGVPMSQKQARFIFAETQRYMLEFIGAYRYQYVFRPRMMDNTLEPPSKPAPVVGAFTRELRVADDFYRAGIPVWLVRPASVAGTFRVDSIQPLTYPRDINITIDRDERRFPVTFSGAYGNPQKYKAFAQYSLSFLSYPDPFNSATPTLSISQPSLSSGSSTLRSASSTRTISDSIGAIRAGSTGRRRHTPYPQSRRDPNKMPQSGGRDKFELSKNPLVPSPLPVWSSALANVNRMQHTNFSVTDKAYIFPEPDLIVGPQSEDRQALYLFNWLRYRLPLIYRLVSSSSQARPFEPQLWRTLLNLPADGDCQNSANRHINAGLGRGKTSDRVSIVRELLKGCLDDANNVSLKAQAPGQVQWRGQTITATSLPPLKFVHEILWEVAEINFRFEFVALDRRAHVPSNPGSHSIVFEDRRDIVSRCFPGKGWSMVAVEWADAHSGIGSLRWQDRAPFVLAMRDVMKTWKGYDATNISSAKQLDNLSLQEYTDMEAAVASFYTQSFFDFFGRAAVLPRSLNLST